MDRESIILAVKNYTNMSTDEITTVCQNHIDTIQDNDICGVYDFSFLTDYAEINTSATYSTGTASITQDSTSVVGTDTVWVNATHAGWLIKFGTDDEYYEIASIDNDTQTITLTSTYIGTTDTDATYTMYKIFYSLPSDFKKMKSAKQLVSPNHLSPLTELTMNEYYPDEFAYSGEIKGYILSGTTIRFYPYQTTRHRIYLSYVKKLPTINSTGGTSVIPSDKHMLFVYKLNEIIFDMHSMPQRAMKEQTKFNNMLYQFIREDKQKTKDKIDILQSHFLTGTMGFAPLDPSHYKN